MHLQNFASLFESGNTWIIKHLKELLICRRSENLTCMGLWLNIFQSNIIIQRFREIIQRMFLLIISVSISKVCRYDVQCGEFWKRCRGNRDDPSCPHSADSATPDILTPELGVGEYQSNSLPIITSNHLLSLSYEYCAGLRTTQCLNSTGSACPVALGHRGCMQQEMLK